MPDAMTAGSVDHESGKRRPAHRRAASHRTAATVRELLRYRGVSESELRADTAKRWAIERGLLLCIQNSLDIASHAASVEGRDPRTYAEAIDSLVETEVLPRDFGERFRGVAGFRNIIVHGYLELDLGRAATFLNEQTGDFEEFARHIERWLAK